MLRNFDRFAERFDHIESDHLKVLYYDLAKGYQGTYKSYNHYRFCTILTGKKKVAINGREAFYYTDSEYLLLPPTSSVEMSISSATKAVVYEISDQIIEQISDKVERKFHHSNVATKKSYSPELFNSLKNLNIDMYQHSKDSKFFMDLHTQELVYRLLNDNNAATPVDENLMQYNPAEVAKEIIDKPGNEHLSIAQITEMLKMSNANLSYYFKKSYGLSPKKYQNKVKIERSLEYLKYYNVTEVAMKLGFDNISHFIRLFKAEYGTTPKQLTRKLFN